MTDHKSKTRKLSPQAYGVWKYALEVCEPDGTFHQTAPKILQGMDIDTTPRTISRILDELVRKKYLLQVEPRKHDKKTGWITPAKYKVVLEFRNGTVRLGGGLRRHEVTR